MSLSNNVLDNLYAAPASPDRWADVLTTCIAMVGADSGWVNELDRFNRFGGSGFVRGVDPCEQDRYFAYYAKLDPFRIDAPNPSLPTGIKCDENFISKDCLINTEFYADYMSPISVHSILILRMYDDGRTTRSMHLNYDKGTQWSDSSGWNDLQELFLHLKRAAMISTEMGRIKRELAVEKELTDNLTCAIIHLDHRGRICGANKAGEDLLKAGTVICERSGRASLSDTVSSRFHCALDNLVRNSTLGAKGFRSGGSMVVEAMDARSSTTITITPLYSGSRLIGEPAAVMYVRCMAKDGTQFVERLLDQSQLTVAERKVALMISSGASTRKITEQIGITGNTLKTHLKSIFHKLDVSRRSELVAKLSRHSVDATWNEINDL